MKKWRTRILAVFAALAIVVSFQFLATAAGNDDGNLFGGESEFEQGLPTGGEGTDDENGTNGENGTGTTEGEGSAGTEGEGGTDTTETEGTNGTEGEGSTNISDTGGMFFAPFSGSSQGISPMSGEFTVSLTTVGWRINGDTGGSGWPVPDETLVDPSRQILFRLDFSFDTGVDFQGIVAGKVTLTEKDGASATISSSANTSQRRMDITVLPNELKENTVYQLKIDQSINQGTDRVVEFTTGAGSAPPEEVDFAAVFVYPVNDLRNMSVDKPIIVEFNKEVWRQTVTEDKIILTSGGDPVEFDFVLNGTTLTITPKSLLEHNRSYSLTLKEGISPNDDRVEGQLKDPATISFQTTACVVESVMASFTEEGSIINDLNISVRNLSASSRSFTVKVEIRRDVGVRLESGGTIVYIGTSAQANVVAGAVEGISFDNIGISLDLYDDTSESVEGDTYVDVYLLDNNGRQIGDAFHQKLVK